MNQTLRAIGTWLVIIVLGASGVVLAMRLLGPINLSINQTTTTKTGTFDVSGTAEMAVVPDKADISLGIVASEPTVRAAQDRANQVINRIEEEMARLGVKKEDIKTEVYSVFPAYDFTSGQQRITGYNVNATVNVSLSDFEKLNQAIDAAVAAGANQVSGLSFVLSEEKQKEVDRDLRKEAIADAKHKAEELAGLSGIRLGRVINVSEVQPAVPVPFLAREVVVAADRGGGAPTQIEPGTTKLVYSVVLSYETY